MKETKIAKEKCKHRFHFLGLVNSDGERFSEIKDIANFVCEDCGLLKSVKLIK